MLYLSDTIFYLWLELSAIQRTLDGNYNDPLWPIYDEQRQLMLELYLMLTDW